VAQITQAGNLNRNVSLIAEVTPPGLEFNIDPEQIEQALINLVHNAEQALAGRENGEIRLSAGLNQRGRVTIELADNGTGIKEDILNRIFVPYFTTKPDGSGIGLALARQIMAYHGGFIKASNNKKGGASFKLTF
jgi:two-component system nitrogen regulation sensor histidine kinase NtrY